MAAKLTSFSKFLITLFIVAGIFFGGKFFLEQTEVGGQLKDKMESIASENSSEIGKSSEPTKIKPKSKPIIDANVLNVQLVTSAGMAPGLYYNDGIDANEKSGFYKNFGFKVNFVIEDDYNRALEKWAKGEIDIMLQSVDVFSLYTSDEDVSSYKPLAFMQTDWSRGADAIVVKRGIKTANDLKGKRIAVTYASSSFALLINTLQAADLSVKDVTLVKTSDNLRSAALFRTDEVDAAVVRSPDDKISLREVPDSKILLSTIDQTHAIAGIMFASEETIRSKQGMIASFYEGWMKGVADLSTNATNRSKAIKYLSEAFNITTDEGRDMFNGVYLANHGDNINFFGLNSSFKGQKGQNIYEKMDGIYNKIDELAAIAPPWRSSIYTGAIQSAAEKLIGNNYQSERSKIFSSLEAESNASPKVELASKHLSIGFFSGKSALDNSAKNLLDAELPALIREFGGSRFRIEGNIDIYDDNKDGKAMTYERAKAVADYLIKTYNLSQNQVIVIGNGSDFPVAGCETSSTEICRAKNRRTEIKIVRG